MTEEKSLKLLKRLCATFVESDVDSDEERALYGDVIAAVRRIQERREHQAKVDASTEYMTERLRLRSERGR